MKVLHITTIDKGGAYKAVMRLNEGLIALGIESGILLRTLSDTGNPGKQVNDRLRKNFLSKAKNVLNLLGSCGEIMDDRLGTDISTHPLVKEADILVLHWINSFLSDKGIKKLAGSGKPMVWVMHDMWLFTGGCHVDRYCGGYENGCKNCPLTVNKRRSDLAEQNFKRKENMIASMNVVLTGPSEWIVQCAEKSRITKEKKIYHIPNAVNADIFRPLKHADDLKVKYGITKGKKTVLFGAADAGTENANKGFSFLREAFHYLPVDRYTLVIFGNCGEALGLPDGLQVIRTGFVADEARMVELYNISDVLVNPSNQESFGYTVCEAMACGTPAVGFPIGGIREQITHMRNGYLAKYQDAEDLAKGIRYCVEHTEELGKTARRDTERYSYEKIASRHIKLYEELLEKVGE